MPPRSPASHKDAAAALGALGGRTLRASDLVRANSSASSDEQSMLRKRSSSTGLGSSLLQGFGAGPPPSPGSSEDALFKGPLLGIPLPGAQLDSILSFFVTPRHLAEHDIFTMSPGLLCLYHTGYTWNLVAWVG
jgi:hypothetical protein